MSTEDRSSLFAAMFSNVGHSYTHMFTILYATAVIYLPDVFGVPFNELFVLSSLGLILYGVGALPAGWLGDRWSQIGMMIVFFVGIGAGTVLVGLATGTRGIFLGLSMIGLFAAIYHPVGIAWLVANARRQGMTLGVNGLFGSVGNALAPVFVGLMIDFVSWRAAFLIPGGLSVVTGIGLLMAWRLGWIHERRQDRKPADPPPRGAMRRVFIILTLTMLCSGFIYAGLTNTMPKLFESRLGEGLAGSATEVGLIVGAVLASTSVANVFGGWLADRYRARVIYLVCWVLQVPFLLLLPQVLALPLVGVTALILAFHVTFLAAENMLVARYTPFEWRSLAYGAKFVLAIGVGGVTVWMAGHVYEASGSFDPLYLALGIAACVALLCAFMLPRERAADRPTNQEALAD